MSRTRFVLLALLPALLISCAPAPGPKSTVSRFAGDAASARVLATDIANDWIATTQATSMDDIDGTQVFGVELDRLGMAHVRVDQLEGGVPVFGGQSIVHIRPDGSVGSITDGFVHGLRVDTTRLITEEQAIELATEAHDGGVDGQPLADLQVLRHGGDDLLTWRVSIDDLLGDAPARPVLFIDAYSGAVVWAYDNLQTIKNRRSYDGNNRSRLPGSLRRTEGQGPTGDVPVDDAHDNAGITYDYYLAVEGRDSIDGAGKTLVSTAHHLKNYDNAFWNGSQMVYGDGATYFTPLSGALDVVGHELTHAVTEFSANLIYANESGGLNEAMSDILGVAIENWSDNGVITADTWMVGEDIAKPALGAALRYMNDPTLDGKSIDNYADYTAGLNVHYSSGIANKAFYLMATDPSMDLADAAGIFYRGLTVYMTPSTTFSEGRGATVMAAADIFGAGSPQVAATEAAWTSVGVLPGLAYTVIDSQTNLSGSTGSQTTFSYTTAPGSLGIKFVQSGGTGDADLYVKFGSAPTTSSYDCRPFVTGNAEACVFEPDSIGTYYVMINAYAGFSGLNLTVSEAGGTPLPNVAPTADAGGPYAGYELDTIAFDGTGSWDSDGSIVSYAWDFGDGGSDVGPSPTYSYGTTGTYVVTLTVTDDDGDGDVATTSATVTIAPPNVAPTADADGPYAGVQGAAVSFDGTFSSDSDGSIVSYDWDFGDGGFATGATPTHAYAATGTYTVLLTVTDDDGAWDVASTTATIAAAPACSLSGTVSSSNADDYLDLGALSAGTAVQADLTWDDASADLDLHLQYLSGNRWRDQVKANNGTPGVFESISYTIPSNRDGSTFRYWVRRRSGTATYCLTE